MLAVGWVPLHLHNRVWDDAGCRAALDCCIYRPIPQYGYHSLGDVAFRRPIPTSSSSAHSSSSPSSAPSIGSFAVKEVISSGVPFSTRHGPLAKPVDYELTWSYPSFKLWVWRPIAPRDYVALGVIASTTPDKPSLDLMRCVHRLAVQPAVRALEPDGKPLWSTYGAKGDPEPSVFFRLRPTRGYDPEKDAESHVNQGLSALFVPTPLTSPPLDVWVLKTALSTPLEIPEDEDAEDEAGGRSEREDFLKDIPQKVEAFEIPTPPRKAYTSSSSSCSPSPLTSISSSSGKEKKGKGEKTKEACPSSSSTPLHQVDLRGSITLFNDEEGLGDLKADFSSIDTDIIHDVLVNFNGDLEHARAVLKEMVEDRAFYASSPTRSTSTPSSISSSSSSVAPDEQKKQKDEKDVEEAKRRRSEFYQETVTKLQLELEKVKVQHGEELQQMATIASQHIVPLETENKKLKKHNTRLKDRVEAMTCVVCMQKRRNIFLECRHFILCDVCVKSLTSCPICRAPFREPRQVIYS